MKRPRYNAIQIYTNQINIFFNEINFQIFAELEAIVDKLATDSQRGSYTIKKLTGLGISLHFT